MSVLEDRYRFVLRVLPASYRAVWEEQMVATFLDRMAVDDPHEAEFLAAFGRPSWSEVASVAALAVRLRLGGVHAPPRSLAWGEAVRRVALIGLLAHAMLAPIGVVNTLWVAGKIPWLPAVPGDVPVAGRSVMWHIVWTLAASVWVAAYVALVFGHRRAGRLLALLAFVPLVIETLATTMALAAGGLPTIELVMVWSGLLIVALPLLALAAFHRDAPPLPRRPWLVALAVVLALSPMLPFVFGAQPDTAPSWRWMLLDPAGVWSVGLVAAAVVHLTGRALARARRWPVWPLVLALLAPAVLGLRLLSLLGTGLPVALITLGMVEAVAVLAVGVSAAVLAAQALRRLPPAPAASRRRTRQRSSREVQKEAQAGEYGQTATVGTFKTRTEADVVAMTLIAHGIPAHVYESGSQHPSLDWVQGIKVVLAAEDLEPALQLLADLEATAMH